ncbi:DnaJ domain-containing protein [Alicyclobacillus fodiniaquatilis]|jgi:DnaJ-domain-containing protein 1|uniref:DnaJ domain-containing protein n=1 Tax=Alicyclobacillus fodiniaquatilis TaxID=1661150 RepID=A0ABW4JFH9_9BACL
MDNNKGQEIHVCPYCHTVNRVNSEKLHQAVCGLCKNRLDSTYYDMLGISKNASMQEVKRRYHALTKMWHPDKNSGNAHALEVFKSITHAYRVLSDPYEREAYDLTLKKQEITQIENESREPDNSNKEMDEKQFQLNLMIVLMTVCALVMIFIAWVLVRQVR